MNLTRESILKLQEANRYDLIVTMYINESGYAGILPTGEIVDRRFFPEAVEIQENKMMGIEKPKEKAKPMSLFYIKDTNGHGYFEEEGRDFVDDYRKATYYTSRLEADITIEYYSMQDVKIVELP